MKKKILALLVVCTMLVSMISFVSFAADEAHFTVIGPDSCIYSGYIPVTSGMTIDDLFTAAKITVAGGEDADGSTFINYTVNGIENGLYGESEFYGTLFPVGSWTLGGTVAGATEGSFGPVIVRSTPVAAGDEVLVQYAVVDWSGTYASPVTPTINLADIATGKITVMASADAPLAGLKIDWYTGSTKTTYTTDDNGIINLSATDKAAGDHAFTYAPVFSETEVAGHKLLAVYASPSDQGVRIAGDGTAALAYGIKAAPPATGDNTIAIVAIVALLAMAVVVASKKSFVK